MGSKQCQYFKDDKGIGGDCYEEQNGKAKFREEFGVFFCNHHYGKLTDSPKETAVRRRAKMFSETD